MHFVVHEHHGRQRHYDLRLEIGGVLKSWAIPKGPSMNPAERRLAIRVPDHVREYIDYEGVIPAGQYGAGPVVIWDHGTCSVEGDADAQLRRGELGFVLHGTKLRGAFTLVRLDRGEGREWLLIKRRDANADPHWQLQSALTPQRRRGLVERVPPWAAV
jgi:DNA ligase D-like protein (predicted 3'-phosphoesterase)